MADYKLEIIGLGEDPEVGWISSGHHDAALFLAAVDKYRARNAFDDEEIEPLDVAAVQHVHGRDVPYPEPGPGEYEDYTVFKLQEPGQHADVYPATLIWLEGYGD